VRKAFVLVLVAVLLPSLACFKPGPAVTQPPITISLVSDSNQLSINQSATITATVYDQSSQGVTWTISPVNFGTLSKQAFDASTLTASVTYTAPSYVATPTTVTITATSITNPNISSSISFHFTPITVSLQNQSTGSPLPNQTVSPGQEIFLSVNVANDLSNKGVTWSLSPPTGTGTITVEFSTEASYSAPANVSAPTNVTLAATSVDDPTVSASIQITILPPLPPSPAGAPNVVMLYVNGGPVPGQVYANGAFTSLTICNPGSFTACQNVGGILVDTGSFGLRILQSQIPQLKLPTFTDPLGNTLENCASWQDGSFLWGPVSGADVYLGGEAASSLSGTLPPTGLPIQVISSGFDIVVPAGCSNGGTDENTALLLGANGILGVGPEPTDCTLSGVNLCDGSQQSTPPNVYYSCPSIGCSTTDSPVLVPALQQVTNPVSAFSSDANGLIVQLPPVSGAQGLVTGTMTFGIETETNNSLAGQTILTLDANDNFSTTLNGETLTNSFLDSGSTANLFPSTMPTCTTHTNYYCPSGTTNFSATTNGATQGQATVNFSADNADSDLSGNSQDAAFGNFAGPVPTSDVCQGSDACVFDWGLPFFFGRSVFVAIDGQVPPFGSPKAPWWAF
jgi:hypothetical protein